MSSPEKLMTLTEIADALRYEGADRERSVRRLFERHNIPLLRRDRNTFLATEDQFAAILEVMKCSPSESAGRFWHIRGSIRVGQEIRHVKEHSTGCDRKEDAETYRARLEGELRKELLHGPGGTIHRLTIADAGLSYINRPGGLKSYDLWRVDQINEVIGDYPLARAAEAWTEFKRSRCAGLGPATVERFRAILQAAINYAAAEIEVTAPKIRRTERIQNKRIRFLSKDEETGLLAGYAPHVRPIAEILCWQGLRVGEALRLDWREVNWQATACSSQ